MRLRHYDHDGRARFVTFNTHRRIRVLVHPAINQIVIESVRSLCRIRMAQLMAYVIMPEHVHLVMIPPIEAKLGKLIGEIKISSAMRIHALWSESGSRIHKEFFVERNGMRRFAFWQRRCYDRNCRSEDEMWEKIRYCHSNPVSRGLVETPGDWPWSSYSRYASEEFPLRCIDLTSDDDSHPHG